MSKNLTYHQVYHILMKNRYVLLREENNLLIGVNCDIINTKKFPKIIGNNNLSNFVSYIPCGFMEYLNHKVRFV